MEKKHHKYGPDIEAVLNRELEDDDTPYGGIDHPGETVEEFLESVAEDGAEIDTLEDLNYALIGCGIKPVEP